MSKAIAGEQATFARLDGTTAHTEIVKHELICTLQRLETQHKKLKAHDRLKDCKQVEYAHGVFEKILFEVSKK